MQTPGFGSCRTGVGLGRNGYVFGERRVFEGWTPVRAPPGHREPPVEGILALIVDFDRSLAAYWRAPGRLESECRTHGTLVSGSAVQRYLAWAATDGQGTPDPARVTALKEKNRSKVSKATASSHQEFPGGLHPDQGGEAADRGVDAEHHEVSPRARNRTAGTSGVFLVLSTPGTYPLEGHRARTYIP